MNSNYFKSILILLLLLLQAATLTLKAQQQNLDVAKQLKGANISEKEGILSKLNPNRKDLNTQNQEPFFINNLKDKRHGSSSQGERLNKSSNYEFNEHNFMGMNYPMSAVTDQNGNTFITGATTNENSPEGNYVAIKIDSNGNQVWETILPATQFSYEIGIASGLDSNGNFVTTGTHWNGNDMDVKTVKFDANSGAVLWESIFDNNIQALEIPTDLHVDNNGNIYVSGIAYANGAINYLVLTYDSNGILSWSALDTTSTVNSWNEPTSIITDSYGNVYVTGYGAVLGSGQEFWAAYKTIKYDSSGNSVWQNNYLFERLIDETDPTSNIIQTDSMPVSIAVDNNGNCFVTGTFDIFGSSRIGTIKYDSAGTEVWVDTYRAGVNNESYTNGHDIKFVDNDKIYVGGRHRFGWIDEGVVLISYNTNGNVNWVEETLSSINIATAQLIIDDNDLPVIAGLGYDYSTFDQRIRVYRFSDQGIIINESSYLKQYSDTEGIIKFVNVGLDNSNNVYLVLDNFYSATGEVFETVKFNMNSGHNNTDWEITYSNLYGSFTQMLFTTQDNDNNMYVTGRYGYVLNDVFIGTFVLTKYNDQGIIEWEKEFNELNGNETSGIVAKVNSQNEIIVFLLPDRNEPNDLLRVKKYNPNGDLLWETDKTLHNAALRAFFFDDNDNIYVSGSAKEQEFDFAPVFFIVKLSTSGNELWSDYATTASPNDFLYEINAGLINSEGDIILTGTSGYSTMFSHEVDLTVLKYGDNGTLEWINKYPQDNFSSAGLDLALDHLNNIYITAVKQQTTVLTEQLLVLKIDSDGVEEWTNSYSQTNRLIRPYKIMKDSNGDLITVSSSTYWVYGEPTDNKINTVKLNKNDGVIEWVRDTDINWFYADSYIDGNDEVYIFNQAISTALPNRPGMRIEGGLFSISNNGSTNVEIFSSPESSWFFPASITPLSNGNLVLGGDISSPEKFFFNGFYFFESSHTPLSIQDHQFPANTNGNWLGQNYPNPVLNATEIPFYITQPEQVKLSLYDMQGRFLYDITNDFFPKGHNSVQLDRTDLIPGMYLFKMEAGDFKYARKMIVK